MCFTLSQTGKSHVRHVFLFTIVKLNISSIVWTLFHKIINCIYYVLIIEGLKNIYINWINVILDIFTWRLGTLWTVLQVSALQVKDFWRYLTTNLVVWTSRRLTHILKKLSPKAIFNVLNSVTFFSYNTYRCV